MPGVRDDPVAERVVRPTPVYQVPMVPRRMYLLRVVGSVVPTRRVDCASLERAHERQHERERNGEQQYE
jgi:hypothetical protein